MQDKTTGNKTMLPLGTLFVGLISLGLAFYAVGCGDGDLPSASQAAASSQEGDGAQGDRPSAADDASSEEKPRDEAAASTSAPEVPEDAPVLKDEYPALADGVLGHARLVDLPSGVLFQAEGVLITKDDLESDLAQAPEKMRDQLRRNALLILDQKATMELLEILARQKIDAADTLDEKELFQQYFEEMTSTVSVTDSEVEAFYNQNPDMMGGASLEQVEPRIREQLQQQKQQEAVEEHIANVGRDLTLALAAEWVREQAPQMLENAVDKARGNGKPTFVNFGAEGCRPCDMMEPIREKLAEELKEQADVVFVNVRQEQVLSSRYGVRGIPHLLFYDKDGKQVHTHTGFMPEEEIRQWLEKSGVNDA